MIEKSKIVVMITRLLTISKVVIIKDPHGVKKTFMSLEIGVIGAAIRIRS